MYYVSREGTRHTLHRIYTHVHAHVHAHVVMCMHMACTHVGFGHTRRDLPVPTKVQKRVQSPTP